MSSIPPSEAIRTVSVDGTTVSVTGEVPADVRAEVQRVLDRAARRVLAEQLDGDAVLPAPRVDNDPLDGGADEGALL